MEGPQKHAVLQQDLKFRENSILRSKFERFVIPHKHRELTAELGNYVQFEMILIFLNTHQAHFKILRFSEFFSQKSQLKSPKFTFLAQICVPHARKSKFLFETIFWYPKYKILAYCLSTYMWHTKKSCFISEMEILKGPSKHAVLQRDLKIF